MKPKAILLSCILGFSLAVVFIGIARAGQANLLSKLAGGGLPGEEMTLNPAGGAFEVNLDAQGKLVVSDYFGDEIWQIDPASQVYTTYQGIPAPSDARGDDASGVWWVDGANNRLGHLTLETLEVDYWELPGAANPYGTGIDASGKIWVTDYSEDHFYRFDRAASEVCTYTLPEMSLSFYLFIDGNDLWSADTVNDRIYRLDTTSGQYTYWALPFGIDPEGMAVDGNGSLWWADVHLHELVHLNPAADSAFRHAPPIASEPGLLSIAGDQIWYTDWDGRLGVFNTKAGGGTAAAAERHSAAVTPDCSAVGVVESKTVSSTSGPIDWAASSYPSLLNSAGWMIYELPADNFPWGIQASEDFVYFVDNGRQVLARVQNSVSVAACKLADADGDPNTTNDQTPVEDWMIHLIADGLPVEPGRLTDPNGCTVWSDLEPGVSYGVQEEVPPGWTPLGPASHEFGILLPGANASHTFVNHQEGKGNALQVYLPLVTR